MTNFEKYRDKIESIMSESGSMAPAVKNGVPVMCDLMIDCNFCDYDRSDGNCWIAFIEWACKDANEEKEYPCSRCSRGYTDLFEPKPKKTRQSEFLKMFPNAELADSAINICPKHLDGNYDRCGNYEGKIPCIECQKDYWLQEVEE